MVPGRGRGAAWRVASEKCDAAARLLKIELLVCTCPQRRLGLNCDTDV